ncbi:MAG: hypothetical protein JWP97_3158 [Labilithrix sp.]|nr:hypothetical protein [Labilithrix sp.]
MDRALVSAAARGVAFVVLFALLSVAGTASASSGAPVPDPPPARVAAGLFTPARTDDGLAWRVRWVLSPESVDEIYADGPRVLRFALPLPEGSRLEQGAGLVPVTEGTQVVGVVVSRSAVHGREVHATVLQHLARGARPAATTLAAPLAAGGALQLIDGDLGSGTRLAVTEGRVLEQHVGFMAPAGVSLAAREEVRRLTGFEERVSGAAIYVRGDDVRVGGGITATLETPHDRGRPGVIAIALAFGGMAVALVVAASRLRHAASIERADAILAAELDALPAPRRSGEG